ncbi:MAG TPA: ABC transporter substrate-binding protein [Dehalococcoidia bacterium]|nr:ABC transporter substrate-binding protein [Dehalococcoidia bacterium]
MTAAGGAALGTAFLTACGGGDDSGDEGGASKDKSGLVAKFEDTSKQAKRGGVLKRIATVEPATLDAGGLSASLAAYLEFAYARLLAFKPGYMQPSSDEIIPDNAEAWELSPDKLQITLKLRQGVKFHNLPPVNGRVMDAEDVLFSWKRFTAVGGQRAAVANSVNPDAPVISVTSPDARTIVVKFKEPLVYATAFLAPRESLNIVPKEADNQSALDLRNRMLGTGPFYLADYKPSVGLTFKRHVDYWQKDRPYIDQVDYPIVPEYAAMVSQLCAGGIYVSGNAANGVRQDEVIGLKKDLPDLNLYENPITVDTTRMFFGWQNVAARDERVRQAMSMAVDRDLWIDTMNNVPAFTSQGLAVEKRWSTALDANEITTGWWLDPKSKDFGPNAKYFEHSVAEAKKLLAAAGYANGVEVQSNHFTTTQFGLAFPKNVEVWEGMIAEAGFKFKKNIIDYSGEYLALRDTNGKFNGVSYKIGPPAPTNDPTNRLTYEYTTKGGAPGFYGFDAAGKGDGSGDPYVDSQLKKAEVEFDTEKRRALVHDVQRHLAGKQYAIRWAGGATQFALLWPAVRNYRVYREGSVSGSLTAHLYWWLDETQAPLRKS